MTFGLLSLYGPLMRNKRGCNPARSWPSAGPTTHRPAWLPAFCMEQWSRRFVSSRRDRYRIYRSTGGICARCLMELEDSWEIDHITRWVDGGDSRWGNLQPLCKRCHILKTTEENTMKGPLRLASWGTQEEGDGPLRRGHKEGCLVACERFGRGERFTSVILPTRYGKSHLARFITLAERLASKRQPALSSRSQAALCF